MEISLILNNEMVRDYSFGFNGRNSKKQVMTLDGFFRSLEEKELSRTECRNLDRWIRGIEKNNKRLYRILVFTVAFLGYSVKAYAKDIATATGKIDKLGFLTLGVLKKVGFWLCIFCCFVEILKSFLNSDARDVWKIFFKYITIYLVLHSLPHAFQLISNVFDGL